MHKVVYEGMWEKSGFYNSLDTFFYFFCFSGYDDEVDPNFVSAVAEVNKASLHKRQKTQLILSSEERGIPRRRTMKRGWGSNRCIGY